MQVLCTLITFVFDVVVCAVGERGDVHRCGRSRVARRLHPLQAALLQRVLLRRCDVAGQFDGARVAAQKRQPTTRGLSARVCYLRVLFICVCCVAQKRGLYTNGLIVRLFAYVCAWAKDRIRRRRQFYVAQGPLLIDVGRPPANSTSIPNAAGVGSGAVSGAGASGGAASANGVHANTSDSAAEKTHFFVRPDVASQLEGLSDDQDFTKTQFNRRFSVDGQREADRERKELQQHAQSMQQQAAALVLQQQQQQQQQVIIHSDGQHSAAGGVVLHSDHGAFAHASGLRSHHSHHSHHAQQQQQPPPILAHGFVAPAGSSAGSGSGAGTVTIHATVNTRESSPSIDRMARELGTPTAAGQSPAHAHVHHHLGPQHERRSSKPATFADRRHGQPRPAPLVRVGHATRCVHALACAGNIGCCARPGSDGQHSAHAAARAVQNSGWR